MSLPSQGPARTVTTAPLLTNMVDRLQYMIETLKERRPFAWEWLQVVDEKCNIGAYMCKRTILERINPTLPLYRYSDEDEESKKEYQTNILSLHLLKHVLVHGNKVYKNKAYGNGKNQVRDLFGASAIDWTNVNSQNGVACFDFTELEA